MAPFRGLSGLIDCLQEQVLARATGAVAVGSEHQIFLVFGFPLHAQCGELVGIEAVDQIGRFVAARPESIVTWQGGTTAGRQQTLAPSDCVLDRLRARLGEQPVSIEDSAAAAAPAAYRELDAGLVEPKSESSKSSSRGAWDEVIGDVRSLLEGSLKRHSRQLVEVLEAAPPDARSILLAIERARLLPVRAVSPVRVAELLDTAAALVTARIPE